MLKYLLFIMIGIILFKYLNNIESYRIVANWDNCEFHIYGIRFRLNKETLSALAGQRGVSPEGMGMPFGVTGINSKGANVWHFTDEEILAYLHSLLHRDRDYYRNDTNENIFDFVNPEHVQDIIDEIITHMRLCRPGCAPPVGTLWYAMGMAQLPGLADEGGGDAGGWRGQGGPAPLAFRGGRGAAAQAAIQAFNAIWGVGDSAEGGAGGGAGGGVQSDEESGETLDAAAAAGGVTIDESQNTCNPIPAEGQGRRTRKRKRERCQS